MSSWAACKPLPTSFGITNVLLAADVGAATVVDAAAELVVGEVAAVDVVPATEVLVAADVDVVELLCTVTVTGAFEVPLAHPAKATAPKAKDMTACTVLFKRLSYGHA